MTFQTSWFYLLQCNNKVEAYRNPIKYKQFHLQLHDFQKSNSGKWKKEVFNQSSEIWPKILPSDRLLLLWARFSTSDIKRLCSCNVVWKDSFPSNKLELKHWDKLVHINKVQQNNALLLSIHCRQFSLLEEKFDSMKTFGPIYFIRIFNMI